MKVLLTITHATHHGIQTLQFGRPESQQEVQCMYQLRYQVYVEQKRYIPPSLCPEGLEIDQVDQTSGCSYFIAHAREYLVGTVRLIHQKPLPIQEHWWYEEPADLSEVPSHETVEVSRLISHHPGGISIPPSLVPLGLIYCATHFNLAQGIRVGYATLQGRMVRQMERWGLPVRRLDPARCTVGSEDALKDYYTHPTEPACPTYFYSEEVGRFFDRLLEQGRVFKQIAAEQYLYQPPNSQ